jgi:predicted transcriptional regulator
MPLGPLVVDDEGDDLDEAERAELLESIDAGLEDADAGRVVPAAVVLERLRARPAR